MNRIPRILYDQWFSVMLFVALGVAWWWPGAEKVLNPHNGTSTGAIVLIFLLTGASIHAKEALQAMTAWRVHLFINGCSFILMPLAMWGLLRPVQSMLPEGLVLGLYMLALLPTTITSCVVFTQLSHGDVAAAIFNAVGGNLAGVFVCPLFFSLMLGATQIDIRLDTVAILLEMVQLVIVPFLLGRGIYYLSRCRSAAWRRRFTQVNSIAILVIVYFAFCHLFDGDALQAGGWRLLWPLAALVPLHLALLGAIWRVAAWLDYPRRQLITLLFCAPQKTLSLGLPMIAACLASRPQWIGLASLPIIVYHPMQMLVAGLLRARLNRQRSAGQSAD